jgi:serine/threonine protein kinase
MSAPTQRLSRSAPLPEGPPFARTLRLSVRSLARTGGSAPVPERGRRPEAVTRLAARIKGELQEAYDRGEDAAVADYLGDHPELADHHQVMISLLFEEFYLREQHGRAADAESFCARYPRWGDSLASQIRVHHELSRRVSFARELVAFPEAGERVLHYELIDELGEGGSARVFVARDTSLGGRLCALKVSQDRGDEAALQGRLDHRHIVPVHCVEQDAETSLRALCMPYLPGVVLSAAIERLHEGGPPAAAAALPGVLAGVAEEGDDAGGPGRWDGFPARGRYADAVAWVGLKLAEALEHAHGRGVFHRDIKPANILLTWRHGPMLLDFNLAHGRADGPDAAAAATGGTLPYMAPEHLAAFLDDRRWGEVGAAADLYALGLVLRELLAGPSRPLAPVPASQTTRLIDALWQERSAGPPPPLADATRRVPHALDAIIGRLLEPDPARRHPDAAALAEDLRRYLGRRPLRFAANPSRRERAANWSHRNRRRFAATAALGALNLAILGGLLVGGPDFRSWVSTRAQARVQLPWYMEEGKTYATAGRYDEAERSFRYAAGLDPEAPQPWQGLGVVATHRRRYDESVRYYDEAFRRVRPGTMKPADVVALRENRAISLGALGRSWQSRATARIIAQAARGDAAPPAPTAAEDAAMRQAGVAFARAADDLREAMRLADAIGAAPSIERGHRLAFVLLGRGDAASWFHDYRTSVACYRESRQFATEALRSLDGRLDATGPDERRDLLDGRAKLEQLLAQLRQRLGADEPKLAGTFF